MFQFHSDSETIPANFISSIRNSSTHSHELWNWSILHSSKYCERNIHFCSTHINPHIRLDDCISYRISTSKNNHLEYENSTTMVNNSWIYLSAYTFYCKLNVFLSMPSSFYSQEITMNIESNVTAFNTHLK